MVFFVLVSCAMQVAMGQFLPYSAPQMGGPISSNNVDCGNTPSECAGRTIYCYESTCQFDCNEPGACRGTTFISMPMTQTLEVQCKKMSACAGLKVISGAQNTKVQCDDHSCQGVKLHCITTGITQKCEFQCQNDGCMPAGMALPPLVPGMPVQRPPAMANMRPNEMLCQGNVRECIGKFQQELSFVGGNFTCAAGPLGRCLMECADSQGEVACRGATYMCKALNPGQCACKDNVGGSGGFFPPVFNPLFGISPIPNTPPAIPPGVPGQLPMPISTRDCPVLTFPTPKPTAGAKVNVTTTKR